MSPMRNTKFLAVFSALLFSAGPAAAAKPAVAVSVLPVHSLVAGVMRGVGAPALLVRGAASPHDHALRPSDARLLRDADLVFWIGPTLERFLVRPLATLARRAKIVRLGDVAGMSQKSESQRQARIDPHIWLDPVIANRIVAKAAAALSRLDPPNARRYAANARDVVQRLGVLDGEIRDMLAPVKARAFVVFHAAYGHFIGRYELKRVAAVAVDPHRRPGARRLRDVRRRIAESRAVCVFAEPQFAPDRVRALVRGTGARIGTLDPLGVDLTPGPEAYIALMRNLAASLRACLGQR